MCQALQIQDDQGNPTKSWKVKPGKFCLPACLLAVSLNVYKLSVDAEALIFIIVILPLSEMLILEKKERLATHFLLF